MNRRILCFAAALATSLPLSALAQDKPAEGAKAAEGAKPAEGAAADKPATEQPADGAAAGEDGSTQDARKKHAAQDKFGTSEEEEEKQGTPPPKDPNASKYYLGARFRDFIVPGFMFDLFADGAPDVVNVFSGGPEFVLQSGALEVIFSVTVPYADFSMNEFMFKSKDDP
ncbi:MAG: hypothetical protein HOV80_39375, partial [Polyangiaceae bacterium]|nr:hypothetical protein [Polyangiaceae bacterium]